MTNEYIPRETCERNLKKFLSPTGKAGLVFFRGRRRVGKSRLLSKICEESIHKCFYFTGALDESSDEALKRFAESWDRFSQKRNLTLIAASNLSWSLIYETLERDLRSCNEERWIFIDEIQWLARGQRGFVGLFKNAWLKLEQISNLKIVLCGSSNKFFADYSGGEEKILRGLVTHADIWLKPLTPAEVAKYYWASNLVPEDYLFIYQCFGGIPYYLNQLDLAQGVIRAINQGVFTSQGIFLQEAKELLKLDFNERGYKAAERLFIAWKTRQISMTLLQKHSRLAESTLSELISKLELYGIISALSRLDGSVKETKKGVRLVYTDYFLRFYFRVVHKLRNRISQNESSNIFSTLLSKNKNLSIPLFTGEAFENLIHCQIKELHYSHPFMQEFGFSDCEIEVVDDSQSDIVLKCSDEKIFYYLECKWTHHQEVLLEGLDQLSMVRPALTNYSCKKFLVTNLKATQTLTLKAASMDVKIVQADLLLKI